MPSKWKEPSDRAGRVQYRALRAEYKSDRISLRRKTEIEQDLDALCGVGTLSVSGPIAPEAIDQKPVPANTESADEFWKRIFSPEAKARTRELDRSIAVEKAKAATPVERACYLLKSLPDHSLNFMARELVNHIRQESKHNQQTVAVETECGWWVKHWLGPDSGKYNSNPMHGTRSDVLKAVASVYQLLAAKDAADPDWFVRLAEQRYATPPQI
jgi:hypothetical protein